MSTSVQRYAGQCLAGAGLAVMSSGIAWQLRPDLWATGQECSASGGWRMDMPGAVAMEADIAGWGKVRVLARSQDRLAERIGWIVGAPVSSVRPFVDFRAQHAQTHQQLDAERHAASERERLQRLAAEPLPAHECHTRKEILAARAALGVT